MILYTVLYRVADGLALAASSEGPAGHDISTYREQAKEIVRKLNDRAPSRMCIEAGPCTFNYMIADGVVYLTLTERAYPRKLAYAYLADVHKAFIDQLTLEHGPAGARPALDRVDKPYAFLAFDTHLHKLRRDYANPSSSANTSRLADELADVQHIMRRNIGEVLDRGEKLEHVSRLSSRLVEDSKKFRWNAKKLNLMDAWKKYAPFIIVALIVVLVLWWRFA